MFINVCSNTFEHLIVLHESEEADLSLHYIVKIVGRVVAVYSVFVLESCKHPSLNNVNMRRR